MSSRSERIKEKLLNLNPIKLEILDETHKHKGHLEHETFETHLKIIIVADQFKTLNKIQRHRLVYAMLADEFEKNLHALSLTTSAPGE